MSYDIIVIGSGPGGYVCAIKAAQLGKKVAIIEKRSVPGGTCLNIGCIPSKALLHASEIYATVKRGFDKLGIKTSVPELDLSAVMRHKQSIIDTNTNGITFLLEKNKVSNFTGSAKIISANTVELTTWDRKKQVLETHNIVIATGSQSSKIPGVAIHFDEEIILSSTGALSLMKVPKTMVVIGAGIIGSELSSIWRRFGSKVIILELLDKVLGSNMDEEISKQFQKIMEKQGIVYKLGVKVTFLEKQETCARILFKPIAGGVEEEIKTDVVLIATGRLPYTEGLGLEKIGVILDSRGRIEIDNNWHTNIEGIYAIGDVTNGPMLAHKAEEEGIAVAEIIAGQKGHVNFSVIPSVVYTEPEVACIGKTEEALKSEGIAYKVGKFPFTANGRARAMLHEDGFVKILACTKTDRILGAHILGFVASEMIHEIAVLMEFGGSSEDLGRICHAHPTFSEVLREAALAIFAKPLHI